MTGKTILVTAVGSFSAEAVIRRYKEAGYRVLGCDIYPAEWIAASAEVDRFYLAPYAVDREAYLDFLGRVCSGEQVDYLVPLTDVEADAVNEWREQAAALGVTVCLSSRESVSLCRDKWAAAELLRRKRVCRTIPARRLTEVKEEEEDTGYELLEYPLILKPDHGRSSQGMVKVRDAGQMQYEMERLRIITDFYLVQPLIEGHVVTVDVVRRPAGSGRDSREQIVCLPRRELLRTGNGAGTSVYVFRNKELEDICASAARALDIRGCVNFEFVEEREGRWHFLECNPRFSGGVAFSCMAGYNMPGNHLRCFMGEAIEPIGQIPGQYLVKRYTEYRMKTE